MEYTGSISVIYGPMFSGKTTELLRRIRRHQIAERKCLLISYKNDNRYTEESKAFTHDKIEMDASKVGLLCDVDGLVDEYEVIGIDEGQFFDDLLEKTEEWANKGKTVIVAALDADFNRKPFKEVCQLLPLAEKVKKLNSVCFFCNQKASFTKKTKGDKNQLVEIGGKDVYQPACRKCFYTGKQLKSNNSHDNNSIMSFSSGEE